MCIGPWINRRTSTGREISPPSSVLRPLTSKAGGVKSRPTAGGVSDSEIAIVGWWFKALPTLLLSEVTLSLKTPKWRRKQTFVQNF